MAFDQLLYRLNSRFNISYLSYESLSMQFKLIVVICLALLSYSNIIDDTNAALTKLKNDRFLRGIQLQITKGKSILYNFNIGSKNNDNQPIDNSTVVKIASLSKSFASVALLQLVEQSKISLNTSLSDAIGFDVINPFFPETKITLEMVMSHQSSIVDCDPVYWNFLSLTSQAQTGQAVPRIRDLLVKGGKYYGECLFSKQKPGTHFQYSNFNYGIIGTVIQRISGTRFDIYMRDNILKYLATNQTQIPTFAAWTLYNHRNLATLYRGNDKGQWVPQTDYYPGGVIPVRNVTDYLIGSNGLLFSPQAGLRASVTHMCNYVYMLANNGVTRQNVRILEAESVKQLIKARYQYHGIIGGEKIEYQNYGFGIYKTSLLPVDRIIEHQVTYGHIGQSYGLLSGYYFWKDYTFSFYFTGNLKGYINSTGTMYEQQRMTVHKIVNQAYLAFEDIENIPMML